jgi:Asp-tRNA(Asn)/Glu-tRNA(Gln) amidotransferase A subunit family amidase
MSKAPSEYPRLYPSVDQTIVGVGRALREGRTSCVKILEGCLEQVDKWEPKVHAWVVLDREKALESSRERDGELKSGNDRGPLHGIPIGIKDIIDVAGLPTACGSKRWSNRIAEKDADVVANLREAGAVILGKTVTTPYAWIDPPITRNPWNLDRTPGGSSSGSAAAVASGMCCGAIGSQTGGSITRPASFCGVAGMKPTSALVSTLGVFPLAPNLDHVGPIARTVDDLRLMLDGIGESSSLTVTEAMPKPFVQVEFPPRLGQLQGFFDRRSSPAIKLAFDEATRALAAAGAEIVLVEDPVDFEQILINHRIVMAAEAAALHTLWLEQTPEDYPPRIRDLVEEGGSLWARDYLSAEAGMVKAQIAVSACLRQHELCALITPATVGTAPDPSTTGDPAFNSPWSYTHLPTVSFPLGHANDGLPLAVQLVGPWASDCYLLRVAYWCEQAIWVWRLSQAKHDREQALRTLSQ